MTLAMATGWPPPVILALTLPQVTELTRILAARNRGR